MKKLYVIGGISASVLLIVIATTFIIFTFFFPAKAEAPVSPPAEATDEPALTISEKDSLIQVINELNSNHFFLSMEKDSLLDVISQLNRDIAKFENKIAALGEKVTALESQQMNMKELAKTYESLKPKEMEPILAKIDDQTLIALYKNMSSRNRKNLLLALTSTRAAVLTQQLAGVVTVD
ncbi:MAG: hypothetical protein ACE5D8_01935 [Fidelibacterota bacterium]